MSRMGRQEVRSLQAISHQTRPEGRKRKLGEIAARSIQYPPKIDSGRKSRSYSSQGIFSSMETRAHFVPAKKKKVVSEKRSVVVGFSLKGKAASRSARKGGVTQLEAKSISEEQQNQYGHCVNKFKGCKENGFRWPLREKEDETLADYFDVLYQEGRSANYGEKTVAGMEFFFQRLKGQLLRSRRALRGWRKAVPPQTRLPLPKVVAYGIAMRMMELGEKEMALMVLLSFDAYLTPEKAADLVVRNLVAPVRGTGRQYQTFTLVVREEEEGVPDKTGIYSNSLPLDNPDTRSWLGPALRALTKKKLEKQLLFQVNPDKFRNAFRAAGAWLGLPGLHKALPRTGDRHSCQIGSTG